MDSCLTLSYTGMEYNSSLSQFRNESLTDSGYQSANMNSSGMVVLADMSSMESVHAVTCVENPAHTRDGQKKWKKTKGTSLPFHPATVSEEERRDATNENHMASIPARGGTALK